MNDQVTPIITGPRNGEQARFPSRIRQSYRLPAVHLSTRRKCRIQGQTAPRGDAAPSENRGRLAAIMGCGSERGKGPGSNLACFSSGDTKRSSPDASDNLRARLRVIACTRSGGNNPAEQALEDVRFAASLRLD